MSTTATLAIDRASFSRRRSGLALVLLIAAAWALPSAAISIPGEAHVTSPSPIERVPLVIGARGDQVPVIALPSAAVSETAQLESLRAYNRRGELPLQNGFTRSFEPVTVVVDDRVPVTDEMSSFAGGALVARDGQIVWSATVEVAAAYALRLHLENVQLPPGAAVFVADSSGHTSGPVGAELLGPGHDIWLPPVFGTTARVEIQVDRAAIRDGGRLVVSLGEIAELVDLVADADAWTDCDIDATCVGSGTLSVISNYREAVAHLFFMDGGSGYICTGGLINDNLPGTPIPYLLTAHHCFSSQASASSLIAYFDYRSSTCNGSAPSLNSVPHVSGSTLLATNASSDFTFVRLSGNPTGTNFYLGWDTSTPAAGTTLYRVSHPAGTAQKYSAGSFNATGGITCTGGLPRPNFLYTAPTTGATAGGSSGAPVIVDAGGGEIVGQLYGTCHFTSWDECSYGTFNWVDGAFATTYSSIAAWLGTQGSIFSDGFESGTTSAWSSTQP